MNKFIIIIMFLLTTFLAKSEEHIMQGSIELAKLDLTYVSKLKETEHGLQLLLLYPMYRNNSLSIKFSGGYYAATEKYENESSLKTAILGGFEFSLSKNSSDNMNRPEAWDTYTSVTTMASTGYSKTVDGNKAGFVIARRKDDKLKF